MVPLASIARFSRKIAGLVLISALVVSCTLSDPAGPSGSQTSRPSVELKGPSADIDYVKSTKWAVVLAGSSSQYDALLKETTAIATKAGYESSITNCDRGAAEAIQMNPTDTFTISVYADSEEAAAKVLADFKQLNIVGSIVLVEIDCEG